MGGLIEEWKPVNDYEELYEVSNLGRVRNKKGKILKPYKKGIYGHCIVGLSKNNKCKKFQVHRLVAIHFVPNPENKPEVCHIDNILNDEGMLNNSANNLMWGTHIENCQFENTRKRQSQNHADFNGENNPNYGNKMDEKLKMKMRKEKGKKVLQWKGETAIALYDSLREAGEKTGIHWTNIRRSCDGEYSQAGGYKWTYARLYDVEAVVAEIQKMLKDTIHIRANKDVNKDFYKGLECAYEIAIEIVRRGGVNNG